MTPAEALFAGAAWLFFSGCGVYAAYHLGYSAALDDVENLRRGR